MSKEIKAEDPLLYNLKWPAGTLLIDIERHMIRKGGQWSDRQGNTFGKGLFFHYRQLQSLLWPDDDHHEWSDLMLESMVTERITTVQGPKDCSKTRTMAKFALTDYFCFPDESLYLISSTTLQGLQLRVWGDIKGLLMRAKEVWPAAPGNALESRYGIFTDQLDDYSTLRDMRKGIICVAMRDSSGTWVGLSQYTGIKQKRRRLLGDEVQFYQGSYLSTLSNLDKGDFKGVFVGNPIGELDPLDKLAEPADGWDSLGEIEKTTTWRNNWDGKTIQLFGPDSPAIRKPGEYVYLTDQLDIDRITRRFGKDSIEYFNQALGVRRGGTHLRRVYTKDMARKFGSMEPAIWGTKPTLKIYGLDAAYGGDRCVGIMAEFGEDINGDQIIEFSEPRVIPIVVYSSKVPESERVLPEDQIVKAVRSDCEANNILPENVFYDATGRGSLGTAFARLWSADVNPIEFGGSPSQRPVCNDLFIEDPKTHQRRLKLAFEHYKKFVTELWFAVRYAGEGRQLRSFPESALDEMGRREWTKTLDSKYVIETKEDYKKRYNQSPDNADALVTVLEGARRRGFNIANLAEASRGEQDDSWKDELRYRAKRLKASYTLSNAA